MSSGKLWKKVSEEWFLEKVDGEGGYLRLGCLSSLLRSELHWSPIFLIGIAVSRGVGNSHTDGK